MTRPRHPLALAGRSVSLVVLLDYPLVIPGMGTAPRHEAEGFFEAHGIALPQGCTETQSVSLGREPVGLLSRSGANPGELAEQLMDVIRDLSS